MMSGKLYCHQNDFRGYKVRITAQISGNKLDLDSSVTAKQLDANKFPLKKVPAFESNDGLTLCDTNAICYYLANQQLKGKTTAEQCSILQWINYSDNNLYHAVSTWVYTSLGLLEESKKNIEKATAETKTILKLLNNFLANKSYLVGDSLTLADISVSCNLLLLYQKVLEPNLRKEYENLNRWFTSLINDPSFKAVAGEVTLCEAVSAGKENEVSKKSNKQKKKEKPPVVDSGDDLLDDMPVQPKPKDPFEKFPKGKFDMDDFKRFYSNNPEEKSIPYFWEKFDKENYSIWFCEYKYPEELSLIFMSCNLMSGMYQRLDRMRKNAFGSMILFGEDYKSSIAGLWIWRGHELAFNLSPDWEVDYESYTWRKLDPDSEETKKLVEQYFKWEGDFGGRKINQGKIFK